MRFGLYTKRFGKQIEEQDSVCSLGYWGINVKRDASFGHLNFSNLRIWNREVSQLKEPRSGSLVHVVFLLIVPFSFLTIRSTGLPQIRMESYTLVGIGDKVEKSVGTAGLRNPIRDLPPPTYSFFIYCNHRQKCWEGCYFLPLFLFLLPPPLAHCWAKL